MKKIFVLMLFIFGILLTSCQKDELLISPNSTSYINMDPSTKRSCGYKKHMEKLMKDPSYKSRHEKKLRVINEIVGLRATISEPIILPIAVHFQGVTNPDIECLRTLAQNQVDVLNKDYGGKNNDVYKWNDNALSTFPGVNNGEAQFKFCLASKNHPSGFGLVDGDLAVTVNKTTGDSNDQWAGYINIFVQPNTGVLGYSPLGGAGNGDGVVIDSKAFGTGQGCGSISPNAPFNLGRTLTHELGHYLLLDHIWGAGCGVDDEVSDTPDAEQEYYGCPDLGSSSCGSSDMFMNYMDYVNDECMFMFSAGQITRTTNYITTSLQNIVNKAESVCENGNPPTEPTCSDGIQNGKETGIDCGGPECLPCQTDSTDCEFTTIGLNITLDDWGGDVSWDLIDETGAILYSGDEYPDFQAGEVFKDTFCLVNGCYTLIVNDLFEDGLCCEYGEGGFEIVDENGEFIIGSDGFYGAYEIIDFCVGDEFGESKLKVKKQSKAKKIASKVAKAKIAKQAKMVKR